jgi:Protein of unknown function (DUF1348)
MKSRHLADEVVSLPQAIEIAQGVERRRTTSAASWTGRSEMTIIAPPFTLESTIQKVRLAEDGWNTHDPEKVSPDSRSRKRSEFVNERTDIVNSSPENGAEFEHRLIKDSGPSPIIALPCATPMNGEMTAKIGFAPKETRTGMMPRD